MAGLRATLGSLGDDPGLGVRLKGLKVSEEDEESEIDEEEVREIQQLGLYFISHTHFFIVILVGTN